MGLGFYLSLAMIPIMTVLFIIFSLKKKVNNEETKIYSYLLFISIFMSAFEVFSALLYKNYLNTFLFDAVAKMVLICYLFMFFFFCKYIMVICNESEARFKVFYVFSIVALLLVIVTKTNYVSANDMIYPQGLPIVSLFAYAIVNGIYEIVLAIINRKTIIAKKFTPLYLFLLLSTINSLIIFFFPTSFMVGYIICLVVIIMNYTIENPDVKMLEEVKLAKDAADKANSAKSEFLSNMSHEIRTPLNAIVGFSQSLKDDNIPPESMEKVDDIIMASNNLLDIVNGILDISKIEANKLEIIEKEYDIQDILDELIVLTKARIGDRGLEFKVSIDPSIPAVLYGDCTRVKQVVLNILTNAVKYTKEGWVDFKVSSVIKDNICRLIISVEDSGIGIKEESLPKLFSKFDRLNVEKEMTIEGTGLGLAITKKLIELMNGKIIVQSVYGQGSKFTISIDQRIVSYEKPAVKEVKVSESKVIDAHGAKILIVDDNALNIKVASTLISKYNFNIDSANSGLECLDKIKNGNQYDIIFLDDMMPKMSGRDVLAKLKENPDYKIPTVALTANAIDGMKEEYLNAGFDDYLSKPIEKNELERVIKKYIHSNNVSDANSATGSASSVIDMTLAIPRIDANTPSEKADYSGKKLLLVDDNDMNLKVEEMTLKKYNFEIVKVSSGSDAIAKIIEGNHFDLVFLDDMMPGLDGPQTFSNLKDIDGYNTPTVLLTASSYDEVKDKVISNGFNGYLGKPLKSEELDKLLKELLN